MTWLLLLVALAILALAFVVRREGGLLRKELGLLGKGIDELRLTSRARINTVATATNPEGKPQVTRVSRIDGTRRVVVGGTSGSKQREQLEKSYPFEPKEGSDAD
jgi:hypothetical protein